MKAIAIIPARGGSKRIPRKNIRDFHGRPIIRWVIETALASRCFDFVMVSTDDPDIAAVARGAGANVPFLRPANLADDMTATMPVIRHALEWLAARGIASEAVCCIYPTAPFLRVADLRDGLDQLCRSGRSFAFSVTAFPSPIQRALRITANGAVEAIWPENRAARSQDLEPAFHDAGQFYWGLSTAFLEERSLFSSESVPIVLPRYRVHDIDTPEDWAVAELAFAVLAAREA